MRTVFLLSLTASLNPTLVAATTLMLLTPRPKALMFGYLLGAYITSMTLGLIIVFALPTDDATKTTQHTVSPVVEIAIGTIMLIGAFVLHSGIRERRKERKRERNASAGKPEKGPPMWQRQLSKGNPRITFVVGALLTLPGASYIAGLTAIHRLDYSTPVTVLCVFGFNVVMMWLLEVPLISFSVAPDWTERTIARVRAWVGRHAHTFAVRGLAIIGSLLVIKGIVGLIAA